jgi:hypothetical protein
MQDKDKNILKEQNTALLYQLFLLTPVSFITFTNIFSTSNAIANFSCLLNYFQFFTNFKDCKYMPLVLMFSKTCAQYLVN